MKEEESHRKTCQRYNVPGHVHHLTFSCFRRQPFFTRDRTRQWFVDALGRALRVQDIALYAWVIMPEHIHLLVHPRRKDYSISAFLKSLKQPVTAAALRHVRAHAPAFLKKMLDVQPNGMRSHRFWQRGGGYDTNLWTPKYIFDKVAYIHRNPVRRGLVNEATEWEWSSARDHAGMRKNGPIPVDLDALNRLW